MDDAPWREGVGRHVGAKERGCVDASASFATENDHAATLEGVESPETPGGGSTAVLFFFSLFSFPFFLSVPRGEGETSTPLPSLDENPSVPCFCFPVQARVGSRKGENEGRDGFVEVSKLNLGGGERVIVRILFLRFRERWDDEAVVSEWNY